MNPILTNVDGMDEFVITPEPNAYLVTLRITPEEAKEFKGCERLSVALEITPTGAGVRYVRSVADNNDPGEFMFPEDPEADFTPAQRAVLDNHEFEGRLFNAVKAFTDSVTDEELDEYYQHTQQFRMQTMLNMLGKGLPDGVQMLNLEDLVSGKVEL